MEWVFPEGFPNRSMGFSKTTTNRKECQPTMGFPNKWVFPKKGPHPKNTTAKEDNCPDKHQRRGPKAQRTSEDQTEAQKSPQERSRTKDGQRKTTTD